MITGDVREFTGQSTGPQGDRPSILALSPTILEQSALKEASQRLRPFLPFAF
jgi:hypothetical protein